MPTASASCGKCRDCDDLTAACAKCGRSKTRIRGHGLRLSWPKANDVRRAVVGKSPLSRSADHTYTSDARFVHTSFWDVEIHNRTISGPTECTPPTLSIPLQWNPYKLEVGDKELLQYFEHSASRALTTFGHRPTDLGNFLLRMSLPNDTLSTTALLRSLLAFSSVHRHGHQSQAYELKISALRTLAVASDNEELDTKRAIQHVATGMLLYSFEIQQDSSTSGEWARYICGVRKIITATRLHMVDHEPDDLACLLDWVYYNDVMARFSLRHWVGKDPMIITSPPSILPEASHAAPATSGILGRLSEIYESVPEEVTSIGMSSDRREYLKILDWRIRSIPKANAMDEAFELTTLIYFNRIASPFLEQSLRTQQRIDKAFAVVSQLDYSEWQFPVFILGCEARTDNQRAIILDLISRTEATAALRSLKHVKLLLEAIWAQDDLVDGQSRDLSYWNRLSFTMSRCNHLPCFA